MKLILTILKIWLILVLYVYYIVGIIVLSIWWAFEGLFKKEKKNG